MNNVASLTLLGEIETPRPLHAPEGRVRVMGWCFGAGLAQPPPVRLQIDGEILPMTQRVARSDVSRLHPDQPAAAVCGFVIEGKVPGGVYWAKFEAQLPDLTWQSFRTFSLAVETGHFTAAIESPLATGVVTKRVFVEGWALHPELPIRELSLRYGHQSIAAQLGRQRADLVDRFPTAPGATAAGFISATILSAGTGPLRLKAILADDSIAVTRTSLQIDIATDENHHAELDLSARRVPLPHYPPRTGATPVAKSRAPLNLLFVLPGSFASNSALHVAALANELAEAGNPCAVAAAHDVATLSHHQRPRFRGLTHAEARRELVFADGRGPDVIHTWTTRENVRQLTEELRSKHQSRVFVHLEDNENQLLALTLNRAAQELERLDETELDRLVPADLSHPKRSRGFLAAADGVTIITERLREFVPAYKPCAVLRPAADHRYFFPRPRPDEFRRVLDLTPDETVIFYPGNIHAANAAEMAELYSAVAGLNRQGQAVTLIRTGQDSVALPATVVASAAPHVLHLGQILHHHHLPAVMALADLFVQPGTPDAFNDYRFPSKLPEFFSLGRPVILPRSNLGTLVRHGIDAYVLDRADAAGIISAVQALRENHSLYHALSRGAADFSAQYFSWPKSAALLGEFYRSLVSP